MSKHFHPATSSARTVSRLRHDLAEQEEWVGEHLALADALAVGMSEETITEMVLFNLAMATTARSVSVSIPFSKPREGANGADWLWAFVGRGRGVTFLLVQAKKLHGDLATGTYSVEQAASKGQRNKRSDPTLKQRDLLRESSRKLGVPAAYAFYNPAGAAALLTQPCDWDPFFPSLGGVGLAGVDEVQGVVARASTGAEESARAMAPITWPLSCALLCPEHWGVGYVPLGPLEQVVADSLAASGIRVGDGGQDPGGEGELIRSLRLLLVSTGDDDMAEERAAVARGLGDAGIRGVAVWREDRRLDDGAAGPR